MSEFCAELDTNPVLAAAMGPDSDEGRDNDPEERVLMLLRQRGDGRHQLSMGASGSSESSSKNEPGRNVNLAIKDDDDPWLTWADFVGVFLPLGKSTAKNVDDDEGGCVGGGGEMAEVDTKRLSWQPGLGNEELELLRVAFAMVDHGCDGRVSLAALREACAELDGEEPAEGPVRSALEVSFCNTALLCSG